MCTYLKNMAGWKPKDLKTKSFANVQELFDKAMKRVNTFVDMDTKLVGGSEVRAEGKEVIFDAIPLATKPPSIVDWKIVKEGKMSFFQIIRASGSSKRMDIQGQKKDMIGVLLGDLKSMFEPNVEDMVWRNLQENKVLIWKLFDSCGVHFVRFQSLHIFMLVEKTYPLTPATITDMLNKKLQADYWNEMCYQLLKLMTKQLKKQ
ncbi:hypothetical protein Tco_0669318 [Tanacetum coccineum]